MRNIILVCLFAVAATAAVLPADSYLPAEEKSNGVEYLPPSVEEPTKEYLPSAGVKEAVEVSEAPEESAVLADDGYRYKTVRRLKYRHRRDVNEIENEYLPPVEEPTEEVAEVKEAEAGIAPEESAVLADDGYRYKTVRRLKYRHRRDVNEIENEYLPPVEEPTEEFAEVKEAEAGIAPEESAVLADDGYRYKTVRRLKYRHRRDVNEIENEYLPPVEEPTEEVAEVKEAEAGIAPEESAVLADGGYRYKTVRRLKYRHRRDVNEIENEYLPPVEEPTKEYLPAAEVKEAVEVTEAPEESAVLADDGYRYKTVRRLKYRHRRDVNEIANEYLPPVDEPTEEVPEIKEAEVAEAPEESAVLADDGYRYKTVRRLKYRHRRDVNEIENEYLPPVEEPTEEVAEVKDAEASIAPEESAVLADDGYRYKTVRRLKYRHRRDVNEIENEYLPPVEEPTEEVAEVKDAEASIAPEESAVLADDGYRYKTVRRLKYRHRRDVNEIENEYLPPVEEPTKEYLPAAEVKETVEVTEAPEESAILADDGYRYKTVRRLKYRHRRDVSEIVAPEYLPPVENVANEYLPPVEQVAEATESSVADSAVLADDGYRYKTVKRFRYRN